MEICFIGVDENELQLIRKNFKKADFAPSFQEMKKKKPTEALSIFVGTRISKNELDELPNLKYIVTRSTGYDHIDVGSCKERGVHVYNIPDYGTETVTEYTILLILASLRKLKTCQDILAKNIRIDPKMLQGKEANGKTLGILGTGRIGATVIKIAHALGMQIYAYDVRPNKELEEKYGVKFQTLDQVLRNADILSLHLPLLKETTHILNENSISKMKKGAIVINTARGALIDIVALAKALDSGHISGAALDVLEAEDLVSKENDILKNNIEPEKLKKAFVANLLLQKENVIITPHIAYNTEEAISRIMESTINTLKELEKGKEELQNKIV